MKKINYSRNGGPLVPHQSIIAVLHGPHVLQRLAVIGEEGDDAAPLRLPPGPVRLEKTLQGHQVPRVVQLAVRRLVHQEKAAGPGVPKAPAVQQILLQAHRVQVLGLHQQLRVLLAAVGIAVGEDNGGAAAPGLPVQNIPGQEDRALVELGEWPIFLIQYL